MWPRESPVHTSWFTLGQSQVQPADLVPRAHRGPSSLRLSTLAPWLVYPLPQPLHPRPPLQREDKCLLVPLSGPPHWFSSSGGARPCIVGKGALGPFSLVLISLQKRCFAEGLGLWELLAWPGVGEEPPRAVWEELGAKRHPRCGFLEAGDGTAWRLCSGRSLFHV